MNFRRIIASFRYAFHGLQYLFRSQPNARFHLLAATLAVILGFWLDLSKTEWLFILLAIGGVLTTEGLNTALETLCDTVHPAQHPGIKKVKDLGAAAVLIISMASATGGLIVFLPRILALL